MMREGNDIKFKGKRLRPMTVLLLLCILTAVSFAGITAARYVGAWAPKTAQADASAFYFTSDLLTTENVPVYKLADFVSGTGNGTSKISFKLRNFADELRASECDIDYEVIAAAGNGIEITGMNGTITKDSGEGNIELSIPLEAFINGKATITVTAKATAPYTKTLSAVFELYQHLENCNLIVHDSAGSNVLTLILDTDDKSGSITITCPTDVLPDNTDENLTINAGNSITLSVNADAQYSVTFFKKTPSAVFTAKNFSVN